VGKSWTAMLLADALFAYKGKDTDMRKGLLWISGKQYQLAKTDQEIKEAREQIHGQIFEHLHKCPRALIVIDEAEMMRADILHVLGDFMDDVRTIVSSLKDPQKKVSTKEAIIIIVSDFGRDDIKTGDSWEDISERVTRETKAILQEDAMIHRIQYVIPFVPVPELNCTARTGKVSKPVEDLVALLIRQLKDWPIFREDRIVVNKVGADVHAIAEKLMHYMVLHENYCQRNYRGIEGLFTSKVVSSVLSKLPKDTQDVDVVIDVRVGTNEARPFEASTVTVVRTREGGAWWPTPHTEL